MISEEKQKSKPARSNSRKVKFTKAEDATLVLLVNEFGSKNWKNIAQHMPPRTARQCRERWTNYVNPTLSQEPWTQEEDILLIEKHYEFGNHWKIIERFFPSRSKNNIKQRWSLLQNIANSTPPTPVNIVQDSSPNQNILINSNLGTSLITNPISSSITTGEMISNNATMNQFTTNDDVQINQSLNIFSTNAPQLTQQPQKRIVQPIFQPMQQTQPLIPQIHGLQTQQNFNQDNSIPLSVYLNTNSSISDDLAPQSPIIEEKQTDCFQFFDKILDRHEMYINEINNDETWNYLDEINFF